GARRLPPRVRRSWADAASLPCLLLPALGRPGPHGLGLERPVAHVEIGLETALALGLEQLFPELIVGRVRERAKGAFEQQPGIDPGGLDAEHGDGLVQAY